MNMGKIMNCAAKFITSSHLIWIWENLHFNSIQYFFISKWKTNYFSLYYSVHLWKTRLQCVHVETDKRISTLGNQIQRREAQLNSLTVFYTAVVIHLLRFLESHRFRRIPRITFVNVNRKGSVFDTQWWSPGVDGMSDVEYKVPALGTF